MMRRTLAVTAQSAWFECSSALLQAGVFYRIPASRAWLARRSSSCFVGRDTELVIDGVQRSANGFATYTFLAAQRHEVKVAHHLHSGEQVALAIKHRIPVLLLIREPLACGTAIAGAWPQVSLAQGLRAYLRYYRRVASVAEYCAMGFFDEVISSPGDVIQRVNKQFATAFYVARPSQEVMRELYDPLASAVIERNARAQAALLELEQPKNVALLSDCQELWESFQRFR